MFSIVEFSDGSGLSIVNTQWVTPRKREVFWPPAKDQHAFNKLVRKPDQEIDQDLWQLYGISRVFYETDDYEKAKTKVKVAEITSDLQTEDSSEENLIRSKRARIKPYRILDSDSDLDEAGKKRPPVVKKKKTEESAASTSYKQSGKSKSCTASFFAVPSSIGGSNKTELSADNNSEETSACLTPSFVTPKSSNAIIIDSNIGDFHSSTPQPQNIEKNTFQILLSQILQVKEQNKKILSLLEANSIQNNTSVINSSSNIPTDFPITLPLKSIGEIETLEGFLKEQINIKKVVSYFSTIGGTDVKQKTHKLLRFLLTNELASQFNYCGRNRKEAKKIDQCTKKGFSEYFLCKAIIESVKANTDYTTSAVEVVIKNWLKHAPHRIAKEH